MSTEDSDWRGFMGRHWSAAAMFVLAVALAFIWAVYVFHSSIDQNILNCGLATVVVKPFFVYVVLMVRTHEKPA
jgi:hypothetical protein